MGTLSGVRFECLSKHPISLICAPSLWFEDSPSSYEGADTRAALEAADRIGNEEVRADYVRTMFDPLNTLILK